VTDYELEGRDSIPDRGKVFLFSISSIPVLGPTQPPIQWVPRDLSPGKSGQYMKLTTYLYLVSRLRMMGLYLHSPICLHAKVLN
jgi:hypothetical protein